MRVAGRSHLLLGPMDHDHMIEQNVFRSDTLTATAQDCTMQQHADSAVPVLIHTGPSVLQPLHVTRKHRGLMFLASGHKFRSTSLFDSCLSIADIDSSQAFQWCDARVT